MSTVLSALPVRSEIRIVVFTAWMTCSGPTATHGSGGSMPGGSANSSPGNAVTSVAGGAVPTLFSRRLNVSVPELALEPAIGVSNLLEDDWSPRLASGSALTSTCRYAGRAPARSSPPRTVGSWPNGCAVGRAAATGPTVSSVVPTSTVVSEARTSRRERRTGRRIVSLQRDDLIPDLRGRVAGG